MGAFYQFGDFLIFLLLVIFGDFQNEQIGNTVPSSFLRTDHSERMSPSKLKCLICNVCEKSKNSLEQHIAAVHEGKKPFECTFCVKVSARIVT